GGWVRLTRHGDFERVIVAVAMGIVALAKNAPVLLRGERGVMVEMRSRELDFARQVHHRFCPLSFRCTRGTHWILPALPFQLTAGMAAVGGPEDGSIEERARNKVGGEGGRELIAAQGLEMHGVGEQEEEKSKEDGEIGAMPFEDNQQDKSEWAEQEGTFG